MQYDMSAFKKKIMILQSKYIESKSIFVDALKVIISLDNIALTSNIKTPL